MSSGIIKVLMAVLLLVGGGMFLLGGMGGDDSNDTAHGGKAEDRQPSINGLVSHEGKNYVDATCQQQMCPLDADGTTQNSCVTKGLTYCTGQFTESYGGTTYYFQTQHCKDYWCDWLCDECDKRYCKVNQPSCLKPSN